MTLDNLLSIIDCDIDHAENITGQEMSSKRVVFNTLTRHNMDLLSVYYDDETDTINIDVGG